MKKSISSEELKPLAEGLNLHGEDKIYSKMRSKALFVMGSQKDIDEMFLDMSEDVLTQAREEEDKDIQKSYYTIAFLLRKLAHELYRRYISGGSERDSERFLRSVK